MPFTDNSDVYSAVHEDGFNQVVRHVMRRRPSLFNYGTARLVDAAATGEKRELGLLCSPVNYDPEVLKWTGEPIPADADSPLMTEQNPIPVLGTDDLVAFDYCVQVVELAIDFAPGTFEDGLGDQQFAATVTVCAGLACPPDDEFDAITDRLGELREEYGDRLSEPDLREELGLPIVPDPEDVHCFCLQVTVVGSVERVERGAVSPRLVIEQSARLVVDDIRIESTEGEGFSFPDGLERSIECYLHSFVQLGLLPALSAMLEEIVPKTLEMEFLLFDLEATRTTISLPVSGAIPNNPALEEDQLKMYVDVDLEVVGGA